MLVSRILSSYVTAIVPISIISGVSLSFGTAQYLESEWRVPYKWAYCRMSTPGLINRGSSLATSTLTSRLSAAKQDASPLVRIQFPLSGVAVEEAHKRTSLWKELILIKPTVASLKCSSTSDRGWKMTRFSESYTYKYRQKAKRVNKSSSMYRHILSFLPHHD